MAWFVNFTAFQIGWFACVLGGAYRLPWLGAGIALLLIAVHLKRALQPSQELILILSAGLLGAVLDSLPVSLGLFQYPSGSLAENIAPYWIIVMWMLFATTLNISLRWLKGRPFMAGLLGTIGGPLAYYGGSKLGGMTFLDPAALGILVLALNWTLAMPLLMALADRFDGITAKTDQRNGLHNACARAETPT